MGSKESPLNSSKLSIGALLINLLYCTNHSLQSCFWDPIYLLNVPPSRDLPHRPVRASQVGAAPLSLLGRLTCEQFQQWNAVGKRGNLPRASLPMPHFGLADLCSLLTTPMVYRRLLPPQRETAEAAPIPRLQYVLAEYLLPHPEKCTKPLSICNLNPQTPNQIPWWIPEDETQPGNMSRSGELVQLIDFFFSSIFNFQNMFSETVWCQKRNI